MRGAGAAAFVAAAILAAVLVASLRGHGTASTTTATAVIVGAGAAPPARTPGGARQTVFNRHASADRVAADATGVAGDLTPLTARDFTRPIARYRAYAGRRVARLGAAARTLTAALRRGDRTAARAAWQAADSAFARIGAAYGALGTLGDGIDGAPGGLPGGTRDPGFVGLRRIEQGLWTGADPATLSRYGTRLTADVTRLRHVLRSAPLDPLTYATRAHEILEDVQRDRLSATTPSGSGVRATADAVAATRVVLETLTRVLAGRGDAEAQSTYWLARLSRTLRAICRKHHGRYPTVAALTPGERERLNGNLGAALEALAGLPGELETARPPAIARLP